MRVTTFKNICLGALAAGTILLLGHGQTAAAAACPNEAIRAEQGALGQALPDCRAYELVTPSNDNPFITTNGTVDRQRASTTGDRLAYFTRYPAEAAVRSGYYYRAARGAAGWSVEEQTPQDGTGSSLLFDCEQAWDFSADLSRAILADGWDPAEGGEPDGTTCPETEETLAPGTPKGYGNLFLRDGGPGTPFSLLNLPPAGVTPANALLRGYTADLSHILFKEAAPLTENAPTGTALYEWAAGKLHLVTVLPNGEPVSGDLAYSKNGAPAVNIAPIVHAYSADGETVFFYANGNLYVRKNATQPQTVDGDCHLAERDRACTLQVDLKQGGVGESGGGKFLGASTDGTRVFFAADSRLTADSNATNGRSDLYEYNTATRLLRDRTPSTGGERPNVFGISGISEDGHLLYFVAGGVLAGVGPNVRGEAPQPFSANLYVFDGAEISFIATLDREADNLDWEEAGGLLATASSPSGRFFAFGSVKPLTGYDSTPAQPALCDGRRGVTTCREVFLYDAVTRQLDCVSCTPGVPAAGQTTIAAPHTFSSKSSGGPAYSPRQVLDDGRVFITTANPLAPRDTDGTKDVYEWQGGHAQLISSGTAIGDSVFYDTDPSGANVFFATSQGLVRSDTDNRLSIYDARVGGGFHEPPPPPACEGESCRGTTVTAPNPATPGSANFAGREEGPKHQRAVHCKRRFVKRHGRCVKRHPHKKRHHKRARHHRKKHKRSANGSSKRRNSK